MEHISSTRRLFRVAGRTALTGVIVTAALCLTGSAVVPPPVDLNAIQPNQWPTMSQSDDPDVNCGIATAADSIGACLIDGGATVVVSSGAEPDQAIYLALTAVGESAFTAAGVAWVACDVDAWVSIHGASESTVELWTGNRCD